MTMQQAYRLVAEHAQGLPLRAILDAYCVLPAITKEEILSGLSMRHEVFCKEKKYEKISMNGIETDEYDYHSTMLVMRKKMRGIGCARFVHGEIDGVHYTLPMEKFGEGKLDMRTLDALKQSGHRYAEISRLAVHSDFRGKSSILPAKGLFGASSGLLTLVTGIKAYAQISNTRFMMAIVERSLRARLFRMGIPQISLGDPIEHRGTRYPILLDREQIRIPPFMQLHYDRIYREIEQHLAKSKTLQPTINTINPNIVSPIANDILTPN